jgi:heme oxygenase
MSLKEYTLQKHTEAEQTAFMQAVFNKQLPEGYWADFCLQKSLIYNGIEVLAESAGLLEDLSNIKRAHFLYLDFKAHNPNKLEYKYRPITIDYYHYLQSLAFEEDRILAHLYTWHMGDLYGGQMIKKIVPGQHRSLEFKDSELLKTTLRSKLKDTMGDEANVSFDWAIKLMNSYEF